MLDVGQSESIHLHYPNGRDALIDTGGFPYPAQGNFVGERLVSRYLWHLRVKTLLYVLITHPDIDHKKGYSFVRKAFPVESLLYSEPQPDYKEPKRQIFGGESFSIAGVEHLIYHPDNEDLRELSRNDVSVVLRLNYGRFSMLFTGDIEEEGEHRILSQLTPVTALKVAHHGSETSSSTEFLKATRPRIAMISSGRNRHFDHPSQSVLNRLRKAGTLVLCTKKEGSLRLITDGSSWKAQRYSILTRGFEDLLGETIPP
jgi:competence protein ComEC